MCTCISLSGIGFFSNWNNGIRKLIVMMSLPTTTVNIDKQLHQTGMKITEECCLNIFQVSDIWDKGQSLALRGNITEEDFK